MFHLQRFYVSLNTRDTGFLLSMKEFIKWRPSWCFYRLSGTLYKTQNLCVKCSFTALLFLPLTGKVVLRHIPSDLQVDDDVTLSFLQLQRFRVLWVVTVFFHIWSQQLDSWQICKAESTSVFSVTLSSGAKYFSWNVTHSQKDGSVTTCNTWCANLGWSNTQVTLCPPYTSAGRRTELVCVSDSVVFSVCSSSSVFKAKEMSVSGLPPDEMQETTQKSLPPCCTISALTVTFGLAA